MVRLGEQKRAADANKTLTGKTLLFPIQGVCDGSGQRTPVLVHMSVLHLKTLVAHSEWGPENIALDQRGVRLALKKDGRQLLHDGAPLGAYVWRWLQTGINPEIPIEMICRMSSGRCSMSGHRGLLTDFNFMAANRDHPVLRQFS